MKLIILTVKAFDKLKEKLTLFFKIALGVCLISSVPLLSFAEAKELKVITSIKPIHSLVSRVMGDRGEVTLLLKKNGAPHLFSMKPSHMRAVVNADVLFYISTDLEQFLKPMIKRRNHRLTKVAFADDSRMRLLPYRQKKIWGGNLANHHDQQALKYDQHIWLDPDNARRMVIMIEETLSRLDPAHAITYIQNSKTLITDLYKLEEKIRTKLRPHKEKPMILYHDAFQYFEKSFFLTSVGAIQLTADKTPSVKHLTFLKKTASKSNVTCVIGMPGIHPQIATVVMNSTKAGYATVDPLGLTFESGPDLYFQIMEEMAENIANCKGDDTMYLLMTRD
jgi:zinc transport system substrate-binding protein